MRRNRAAVLAGGGLVALQTGVAFGLSSAAPLLGMFHPLDPVAGLRAEPVLGIARLLAGVPGGFLAGFVSRTDRGEPDAVRGLLAGVAAGATGLAIAYAAYLLAIGLSVALGRPLPLSVPYLATVVPLALGASLLVTVPIGALLAGGAGAMAADPATGLVALLGPARDEDASDDPSDGERSARLPDRVERLTERAVYAPDEDDVGALARLLERNDRAVQVAAVEALASVPRSHLDRVTDAVPALVGFVDDDDRAVRHRAAEALARIAAVDPDAVAPEVERLVDRLPDADVRVRNHLTDALRSVAAADPDRAGSVRTLLSADDPAVRGVAVSVLASAPSAATPALDRLLDLFDRSPVNRDAIVPVLAATARESPASVAPALPTLVDYLEGEPAAREAATEAVALIAVHDPTAARPAVGPLATALLRTEEPHRETVAAGLVAILRAFPEERDVVDRVLSTADSWQRFGAERALEAVADDATVGELLGGDAG